MGVTPNLLARMLLLISTVTLVSLLALTRCGLSGSSFDSGIMDDGGTQQQAFIDKIIDLFHIEFSLSRSQSPNRFTIPKSLTAPSS